MVRIFICIILSTSLVLAQKHTVGVLPFVNNSLSDPASLAPLTKGLADMMSTELAKMNALTIIERANLDKVLKEIALSQSGVLDDAAAKKTGVMLGADYLLLGSFNKGFNSEVRIDTRLVNVETGVTLSAAEVTGKPEKLFQLIKKLSFKLAQDMKISLTNEEKTALTTTDNDILEATLLYYQGLDAEDSKDTASARLLYTQALEKNKQFKRAAQRLNALTVHQ